MTRSTKILPFAAVTALGALAACGDMGTQPIERPPVAGIELTPAVIALVPGDSMKLWVTLRGPNGAALEDRPVAWSTTDSLVATVTASGLVRGIGTGVAEILAAIEGRSRSVPVSVAAPDDPAPQLSHISPSSAVMGRDELTITVWGINFAPDAEVLWKNDPRPTVRVSGNELKATIGASDLSVAGTYAVRVRNTAASVASWPLTFRVTHGNVAQLGVTPENLVIPVGGRARIFPRAWDDNGILLTNLPFVWSSSEPERASVDQTGEVTAHAVGVTLVTVELDGLSARARVEVVPAVQYVVLSPSSAAVLVNSQIQLSAFGAGAGGGTLPGRAVTWSSDDPDIASVDGQGLVTGRRKGTARIRATIEGKVGFATIDVREFATGAVQHYELRGLFETPILPTVGTTVWTDGDGAEHEAYLLLTGGRLTLRSDVASYELVFQIDVFVVGVGKVASEQWTDEGSLYIDWLDGSYRLTSSRDSGRAVGRFTGPGELMVEQVIGAAPAARYLWIID